MTTFQTLMIGGGLLAAAALIMFARRVRLPARLGIALFIALMSSGLSASIQEQGMSGTQLRVSRGYPKHFHFASGGRSGMNALFFAGNTLVHFGLFALLVAALPRKMPARVFIIRIALGVVFFILGIVGSLLPVLQGWIFFLISFLLFFPRNRMTKKIMIKAEPKLPRVVAYLRRLGIGDE